MEKKDSDEEPMETVVEKMVDEPEAEADGEEKHVSPALADKMTEDLKPMDTDKESLTESKSPEESIQEDSGSDIAPMQTDDQLKQVRRLFVCLFSPRFDQNWNQKLQSHICADSYPQDVFVPGPNGKPPFTAEPLTLEDLSLLAELFYLPYEHGNKAVQMLREFNWLRANSSVVSVNCKRKEAEKVGLLIERSTRDFRKHVHH